MEILYPDVVGSGGAPKRIMKPRRKTDGTVDDSDMPGAGVLHLPGSSTMSPSQSRPTLSQTPTGSSSSSVPTQSQPVAAPSIPTTMPMPPVTATASSSALTPPDETVPQSQGRKRRQAPMGLPTDVSASPTLGDLGTASSSSSPQKRRRMSSRGGSLMGAVPMFTSGTLPTVSTSSATTTGTGMGTGSASSAREAPAVTHTPLVDELLEALRSRAAPPPRWRESALDIFFRDFSGEELDLQVKISENILSNENKAMVFCKMPERVRQHWVSKFREMHQLNKTT
jgi:hypothetical protein